MNSVSRGRQPHREARPSTATPVHYVGYAIGFLQNRLPPDTPPSQEDEAALIDHLMRNFDLGSSAPTIASEAVSRCRAIIGNQAPPID